jgi:sugar lactone lactonase YvrE
MGLLTPGTEFAGHRIESLVGRGGMGVVYRARQLELDRVVALKVIAPELLEDAQIRERFVREARTAASIEHPNVIPLHYAGEEEGVAYLVMRFIDGDDVRALVRRDGVLGPERAAAITAQAGAALDAIHAAGFVHRDVKPANLLLAAGDHVYVTDFGLAKQVLTHSGATRSGHWVGTVDYVAPEQIRGGRIDARADIYALGGVLHFMLTAHIPFDRDSDEAKMWAHLSDPPPLPSRLRPELPAELDAVVGRAMAKDPDERQPSAGDLGRSARAAARGLAAGETERMVARGAASPDGAAREPGFTDEASTLTGLRPAGDAASTAPHRPWRRRATLGGLAIVVVAAAAVALTVGADDGSSGSHARPPQTSSLRVGQTIANIGTRPNGISSAGSDLWVTSHDEAQLTRIDAATGRERAEHPRVGRGVFDITAVPGAVWVAVTSADAVVRLDPRTGRITRRLRPPLRPVALAAGADDLWVAGRAATAGGADSLMHYDRRGHAVRRIAVPHGVSAIALGGGALWASEVRHARMLRVDLRTGRLRAWAPLDASAVALAYSGGYLWASERAFNAVARIDTHKPGSLVTTAAGHSPAGVAIAGGRVFVASTTDHTVIVIDHPRAARLSGRPLNVAVDPYAMTAAFGHVWVTGQGDNTVTRLDLN